MVERTGDYQPGEHIPGTVYQVSRLIGAGGMGTVYDVEDTSIGKRYVLKTLHPRLGARDDLARRMQNEARTLARLNHPNVVDVITAGVTGDDLHLPYYVMERLNGQSLRLILEKKGQLELPHAYHIGIDLLDALDHAHDKGVIHRDVKPDNIFLHRTMGGVTVTKLLDFGILSLLDGATRETAGRFLGTLRYAAPEQLRGERPTPKMDIYAAALVLYETLAGRGPFDEERDPRRIAAAHLEKTPPPLSRFAAVPPELDRLIAAALAKEPDARPRDAFSFAAILRNLKRAQAAAQARESTENRTTSAAVLGPGSTLPPPGAVGRPAGEGPYVISGARATTGGATKAAGLPPTTLLGMRAPTVGPAVAGATTSVAAPTAPDGVDRAATTADSAPDTSPSPKNGTEELAPEDIPLPPSVVAPPPPLPPPSPSVPLQWPADAAVVQSEEPQPQMVSAGARHSRRSAAGRLLALVAVLGIIPVGLVAGRRATRDHPTLSPAIETHASAARANAPVWPPPAPTLAPPVLDDEARPNDAAAPPTAPPVPKTPRALKKPRAPSSAAALPERPGPGF